MGDQRCRNIEGNAFTETQTYLNAPEITHTGRIELLPADTGRMLMTIDSASSAEGGRISGRIPQTVSAIYRLDDHELTIRMGRDEFPNEFDPGDPSQSVFRRVEPLEDNVEGSAAEEEVPRQDESSADDISGDLQSMQGTWEGQSYADDFVYDVVLTIDGTSFNAVQTHSGEVEVTMQGYVEVDESVDPRQMLMTVTSISSPTEGGSRRPHEMHAIYRLDEHGLTLRTGRDEFPAEFDIDDPAQITFLRQE